MNPETLAVLGGKHVLVTGGTRGIGRAIVIDMVAAGARVSFTYKTSEKLAGELVAQLKTDHNADCLGLLCDVGDFAAMQGAAETARQTLGRIDVLVNNAGIVRDAPFVSMTEEDWATVMNVNLKGTFNATKSVIFDFMKRRSGVILNISSVAGIYGNQGQANYSAAKAGIIGLTRSLAKEVGPYCIRVNAIAPGFIETDMSAAVLGTKRENFVQQTSLRRIGVPREVARVAVFLASDAASYVTGQVWEVNGGLNL